MKIFNWRHTRSAYCVLIQVGQQNNIIIIIYLIWEWHNKILLQGHFKVTTRSLQGHYKVTLNASQTCKWHVQTITTGTSFLYADYFQEIGFSAFKYSDHHHYVHIWWLSEITTCLFLCSVIYTNLFALVLNNLPDYPIFYYFLLVGGGVEIWNSCIVIYNCCSEGQCFFLYWV